jgi:hypothetical protein
MGGRERVWNEIKVLLIEVERGIEMRQSQRKRVHPRGGAWTDTAIGSTE